MKRVGTFLTKEGGYGSTHQLDDGTVVNVITIWSSPGLACDGEIEASRKLTNAEIDAVLEADADVAERDETTDRPALPVQHRA
jgi:hypothetical protein